MTRMRRLFFGVATIALAMSAYAGGDFPTNDLPPPAGTYISPQLWHQLYANGIIIKDVSHRDFVPTSPPPPPMPGAMTVHTFNSFVNAMASSDGGMTFFPVGGNVMTTVKVTYMQTVGTTDMFDTEMLQLDGAFGPVLIRESPSRPSLGKTDIRPISGGYHIDSFFDIFTELSLDGGQSWSPAVPSANNPDGSAHMELTPEPGSIFAIGAGLMGLAAARRRKSA